MIFSIGVVLFFVTFFLYVLSLLGKYSWLCDLLSHFRVQQVILFCVAILLLSTRRESVLFSISLWAFLAAFLGLVPYFMRKESKIAANTKSPKIPFLKIVCCNVLSENTDHDQLLEVLKKQESDLIALVEVNARWERKLAQGFKASYPHQVSVAREDNFGVMVLSKKMFTTTEAFQLGPHQESAMRVSFLEQGHEVDLWVVHPVAAIQKKLWLARNEHLKQLLPIIGKRPNPKIVAGDLNLTPWSYWFSLVQGQGLRHAAHGFGIGNTWNAMWYSWSRVILDYVLVSKTIQVAHYEVLEFVGSDHFPIFTALEFKEQKT